MALTLTPGMGALRTKRAIERLEAAERVFEASLTELEGVGLPARAAQFVADGRAYTAAEDEAKRVAEAGGSFLTPEDQAYPERLREIYDPPAVLWIRGDASLLERPGIAVVGTRQPSPYGAGRGHGGAQRGARCWRQDGGGVGDGDRCGVSEGEQEAG